MAWLGFWGGGRASAASVGMGGSLVATSDYVYRGLSQSGHEGAVQGDAHLQSMSGWFAGVWGSQATSMPRIQSQTEINLYLGHTWTLSPDWTVSAHAARYFYPDTRRWVRDYYHDYNEVETAVSFQDRLSVSLAYSPKVERYSAYGQQRHDGRQLAGEASFRQPLWRNLSLTAGLGYYDLTDLADESYWAWSTGAELEFRRLTFTLSGFQVDGAARRLFGRQSADGRWALTAAWRF